MVPEAKLEKTDHGIVPKGEGWFVLNMRDAVWKHADGRGAVCVVLDDFEGWRRAEQLGVNPFVLRPRRADVHVPLGDRPGSVPRRLGRSDPDRRRRRATAPCVG